MIAKAVEIIESLEIIEALEIFEKIGLVWSIEIVVTAGNIEKVEAIENIETIESIGIVIENERDHRKDRVGESTVPVHRRKHAGVDLPKAPIGNNTIKKAFF